MEAHDEQDMTSAQAAMILSLTDLDDLRLPAGQRVGVRAVQVK